MKNETVKQPFYTILLLLPALLLIAPATNAVGLDLSIEKAFVTEPLYFHYNDTARTFSTEIINSGSLPYIAQLRIDVIDKNEIIFTAWSERKKLMPGNNGFFRLRGLPVPGNYTTRYRVYYSGEINETFRDIIVSDVSAAKDTFNITLYGAFDDFLVLEVKSSVNAKAFVIPYDYPQGWWIAQRAVELKPGTNKIILPYGPLADSQVKFTVVSEDGEYTGSAAINVAKENTLLRFFFRMLS